MMRELFKATLSLKPLEYLPTVLVAVLCGTILAMRVSIPLGIAAAVGSFLVGILFSGLTSQIVKAWIHAHPRGGRS